VERRVAVTCFLLVLVSGCEANGHDEAVRQYQIQIESSEATCHDEIVSVPSKKQGASASAHKPKDTVPGDEIVWVNSIL